MPALSGHVVDTEQVIVTVSARLSGHGVDTGAGDRSVSLPTFRSRRVDTGAGGRSVSLPNLWSRTGYRSR